MFLTNSLKPCRRFNKNLGMKVGEKLAKSLGHLRRIVMAKDKTRELYKHTFYVLQTNKIPGVVFKESNKLLEDLLMDSRKVVSVDCLQLPPTQMVRIGRCVSDDLWCYHVVL